MAWLLDTNILSEGRKRRPEPRVTALLDEDVEADELGEAEG
jgi:predicted nucleic acid-binding protein